MSEFMLLNNKDKEVTKKIKIESAEIQGVKSTKLLGITMDNDQNWTCHFWVKKGLCHSLNQILFAIRRIANHIAKYKVKHLVSTIWMLKLRYCIQLMHKVRLTEVDKKIKT